MNKNPWSITFTTLFYQS